MPVSFVQVIKRTDLNTVVLPSDAQDAPDAEAAFRSFTAQAPQGPSRKSSTVAHIQPADQIQPAPAPVRVSMLSRMTAETVFLQYPRRSSIPGIDLQYGGNFANAEFSGHVAPEPMGTYGHGAWNPSNGVYGANNFMPLAPIRPPREIDHFQHPIPAYGKQQATPMPMQAPPPAVTEFTYEPVVQHPTRNTPRVNAEPMYQGVAYNGFNAPAQGHGDNGYRDRFPSGLSNEPEWL